MDQTNASQIGLDKFEQFLFEMDDILEPFISDASIAGFDLDYSLPSLDLLEEFILVSLHKSDNLNLSILENRSARFLGELFRKNAGGNWELCLKHPKYLYYKLPVISGYAVCAIEFCPIEVIRNFIYSKKKGLLLTAVESDLELKKK